MIIKCNNCNKNFDIDSNLISEKGRLVQCNSCDHKWFFKKKITDKPKPTIKTHDLAEKQETINEIIAPIVEEIVPVKNEISNTIELLDRVNENVSNMEKDSIKDNADKNEVKEGDKKLKAKTSKNKKNYNILGLTIVFIISFIALIIALDTFQKPISSIIPNIEFLLYNLYETINDVVLFFKDLT